MELVNPGIIVVDSFRTVIRSGEGGSSELNLQHFVRRKTGASRVVIDSLSGFEIALAPSFRQDFRESYYRLLEALTALSITVLSTMETSGDSDYLHFSPYNISFLSDDIIAIRYVEMGGQLRTVLSVIKMRGSIHSRDLRIARVTERAMRIGETLSGYRGIITRVPEVAAGPTSLPVTVGPEATAVIDALLRLGELPVEEVVEASGLTLDGAKGVLDELVTAHSLTVREQGQELRYHVAQTALR